MVGRWLWHLERQLCHQASHMCCSLPQSIEHKLWVGKGSHIEVSCMSYSKAYSMREGKETIQSLGKQTPGDLNPCFTRVLCLFAKMQLWNMPSRRQLKQGLIVFMFTYH